MRPTAPHRARLGYRRHRHRLASLAEANDCPRAYTHRRAVTPRYLARGLLRHEWVVAALLGAGAGAAVPVGVPFRGAFGARVTGDEPFYLLTTVSLIQRRRPGPAQPVRASRRYREFLDESVPLVDQSVPTPDGRLLSPHNVGLSLLVLPAYALGRRRRRQGVSGVLGALDGRLRLRARAAHDRPAARVAGGGAAGRRLGADVRLRHAGLPRDAGRAVRGHPGAAAGCRPGGVRGRGLATALLLVGAAVAGRQVRARWRPASGLLALARLSTAGRIALLATAVPIGIHYAAFHWLTYGDLTPYAVNLAYAGSGTPELLARHVELCDRLYRLLGPVGRPRVRPRALGADPGAGAARRVAGKPTPRTGAVGCVLAPVAVQLLVATFLSITMRGWWFPGRMLVVVLPLLVPLVATAHSSRWRADRWSVALLLGARLGHPERHRRPVAVRRARRSDRRRQPLRRRRPVAGRHPPAVFPLYTAYTRGNPGPQRASGPHSRIALVWATLRSRRV